MNGTDGLNLAKLMDIFNAQTATVNTLWNIFAVVAFAILGFGLKEKDLRDNRKLRFALSVAFILFALGNLAAILRSQQIIVAITEVLNKPPENHDYSAVLLAYEAKSVQSIRVGHHLLTAVVVLIMWIPDVAAQVRRRGLVAKGVA